MSESDLPVSLSEISRNSTSATDSIGTMTMSTKNRRRRARKLIELHYGPVLGAIAQLGERLDRTQEVGGSSPPSSIPEMFCAGGVRPAALPRRRHELAADEGCALRVADDGHPHPRRVRRRHHDRAAQALRGRGGRVGV